MTYNVFSGTLNLTQHQHWIHRPRKPAIHTVKFLDMLYRSKITAILFCLFWPKLGCNGNSFPPLKIRIAYFNSPTPITLFFMRKSSRNLVQNWNKRNFCLFGPNMVAMATALAPLKIQVAYLNSLTTKTLLVTWKLFDILYRTEIGAILAYFCPNLFAMAAPFSLCSLENSDSISEFAEPDNSTLHAKTVSISCTELK